MSKSRSKSSSKRWLKEHFSDIYVKRAQSEGYRSRSVYKLIEIQKQYKIMRSGMIVVDLGASPGGWSEYVTQVVGFNGKVFALDILPMSQIKNVDFICGDFTDDYVAKDLYTHLNGQKVDVVLSDMAPNFSGLKIVDQSKSVCLANKAFQFAKNTLNVGGVFLVKIFQGNDYIDFLKQLRGEFENVRAVKPKSSRLRSSEMYLLAKGKIN